MKSSFEKGLIGAAIVASSFGNLEAQETKPNLNEKEINNTEVVVEGKQNSEAKELQKQQNENLRLKKIKEIEKDLGISKESNDLNDPEYYRNEYLKYMEHPSYKQRLGKEMFGDLIIDEEKQKWINEEYQGRLEQLKKVLIEINPNINEDNDEHSNYNPKTNKIETKKDVIFHEISHSLDSNFPPIKNSEEFYPHPVRDKGFTLKKRDIFSSTKGGVFQNKIDSLALKNPDDWAITGFNRIIHYLKQNTELKARLNHLRMKAIEDYNLDLNKDFNINDFNELKKDEQYIELKEGLGLSDEQINELMKYTAENENNDVKGKTYYHPGWDYNDNNNKA